MMRRYPAYRDSGVEWMGEVPEGWEVGPIKAAFDVIGGTTPKSDVPEYWDGEINWVTPADLSKRPSRYLDESARKITERGLESCGTSMVPASSLVLSIRAPIGSLAIAARAVCTNQGCKALVPRSRAHPDFYFFVLDAAREALNLLGRGSTFLELSGDQLAAFRVPLPTLPEQTAIAAFLDRETAKIDALVAEQRRLIDLLREKRQAVISHAVTKGVNPNAPMKPSGVDWLGEVPEHWTPVPIRKVARLESGHTPSRTRPDWWVDCTFPWFSLADVWQIRNGGAEYVYETAELVSELGLANSSARLLPAGTVMLSRTASVGYSAIMGVDMATTQDFANWICGPRLLPEFLLYCLRGMPGEFERLKMGSTHNTIYMPDIQSLSLALPPVEEQREIVAHIRAALERFGDLVSTAETVIALLQERRAALISAAVTGKIDVRDQLSTETEAA